MSNDGIEAHVASRKPSLATVQGLPSERLSPGYAESDALESALSVSALVEQCRWEIQVYRRGEPFNEVYGLELLCRVLIQGDQDARAGIEQCLSELVRDWLYSHPRSEEALRWKSEERYMALAFERFWQTTLQQQVAFRTLAGALIYLCASLNAHGLRNEL